MRRRRPENRLLIAAALGCALGLVAAGCSRAVDETSPTPSAGESTSLSTTTTEVALEELTADEPAGGEPLGGSEILQAAEPNVVLVWTASGLGSGVVLPTGHIVTNSHVVEPYDTVYVSSPDGQVRDESVAVLGADIETDLAVLEPLDDYQVDGMAFASAADLAQGSEVYLIGYPGEVDLEEVDVTISSGLFSRTRETPTFDLTMIQTDADIAGGQSGGALVDDQGRLIGISGLSFTDAFALAIDGARAAQSVQSILAGTSSSYTPEDLGAEKNFALEFRYPYEVKRLTIEAGGKDRTVELDFGGAPLSIRAYSIYGETTWANQAAMDAPATQLFSVAEADVLTETQFDLEPFDRLVIDVATADGAQGSATVSSNLLMSLRDEGDRPGLELGDTVSGTVQPGQPYDAWSIDLDAGQTVTATVGTGIGDPGVWVLDDSEDWNIEFWNDDSGLGLLGLEPELEFTAPTAGTYRVVIESVDTYAMAYELTVR